MTNPFDADEDHTNPFGNTAKDPEKDSYQPPKETVDPASYSPYQAPSSKPAYNEPAYNQSPSYSQNTYKNNHSSNTKKDDEFLDPVTKMKISNKDLDKKEAVLRNREQKLQSIEQQIADGTFQKPKNDKNFPPFVRWWSWHPERDLPENSVKLVKIIRWIYLGSVLVYLVN
ncbi:hypothetical protein TRFO_26381 [Tritrichomonas foetus]|uniref:Uncharacterized protein n=1 Tax=Tritrichomonas foetus TaxID=1144522 RepID=A0A1J4K2W4_9EUKA|nr:hypothetical protein TRFO_26381 [Tritrichomonas foetus]|eukprot:OHT05785.1 hypothetical protein TRFO_26381 [Tritrichomonas foetus]